MDLCFFSIQSAGQVTEEQKD